MRLVYAAVLVGGNGPAIIEKCPGLPSHGQKKLRDVEPLRASRCRLIDDGFIPVAVTPVATHVSGREGTDTACVHLFSESLSYQAGLCISKIRKVPHGFEKFCICVCDNFCLHSGRARLLMNDEIFTF